MDWMCCAPNEEPKRMANYFTAAVGPSRMDCSLRPSCPALQSFFAFFLRGLIACALRCVPGRSQRSNMLYLPVPMHMRLRRFHARTQCCAGGAARSNGRPEEHRRKSSMPVSIRGVPSFASSASRSASGSASECVGLFFDAHLSGA